MLLSQIRVHVVNQPSSVWFFLLLTRLFLEESFQMRLDSLILVSITISITNIITITISSLSQLREFLTCGGGDSGDITQVDVVVPQTWNGLSYTSTFVLVFMKYWNVDMFLCSYKFLCWSKFNKLREESN